MKLTKETTLKYLTWCYRLAPALLLTTPNFTVGVIIGVILIAVIYLNKNKQNLVFTTRFDLLCLFMLSIYLLINIPNVISDFGNFRYFQGGLRLILGIPIYLILINVIESSSDVEKILNVSAIGVALGCFGALGIALYQFFDLHMERVNGFLYSINFGYLSCSLAFLAFCLLAFKKYNFWLLLAFMSACIATLLTMTRGAIFAIPLLLTFILILRSGTLHKNLELYTILGLIAVSSISYMVSRDVRDRVAFTVQEFHYIDNDQIAKSASTGVRIELWKAAIYAFEKSPIIGLTYSQREKLNTRLYHKGKVAEVVTTIKRGHAHNQYFEMLASNGLLGVVGFIFILFVPIYIFYSHHRKTGSLIGYIGAVFVSGWAIFGMTEVPLTANLLGAYYSFMLATFLAIVRVEKYNFKATDIVKIEGTSK